MIRAPATLVLAHLTPDQLGRDDAIALTSGRRRQQLRDAERSDRAKSCELPARDIKTAAGHVARAAAAEASASRRPSLAAHRRRMPWSWRRHRPCASRVVRAHPASAGAFNRPSAQCCSTSPTRTLIRPRRRRARGADRHRALRAETLTGTRRSAFNRLVAQIVTAAADQMPTSEWAIADAEAVADEAAPERSFVEAQAHSARRLWDVSSLRAGDLDRCLERRRCLRRRACASRVWSRRSSCPPVIRTQPND